MKILRCKKAPFVAIILLLVLLVSTFVHPAVTMAFTSGNHDQATQPALDCRVSPDAMEAIKQANKAVDKDPDYKPAAHFDRDVRKTSKQAFEDGAAYVRGKKQEAIDAIKACTPEGVEKAIKAIGEALHAIQDFYSHSNYVDLTPAEQAAARNAFDNPGTSPSNLRLTAYYPMGKANPLSYNPTSPEGILALAVLGITPIIEEGGPYDHGFLPLEGNNKDYWATAPLSFGEAMEAAKKHSQELIDQIIKEVGQALWDQKLGKPNNYEFPPPLNLQPSVPPPGSKWVPYPYSPIRRYSPFGVQVGAFGLVPPEGGILDDGAGTAIFVPSGAVPTPEWFYAFYVSPDLFPIDYLPEGVRLIEVREFWPDGMQFQEPVTISMVYSFCENLGVSESSLRAYEFDLYNDCTWKLIPDSTLDTVNRTVTFQTSHFSIYGIGGSPPPVSSCFIATAAYGTPMAEEVEILREFRDEYLLTNPLGQALVDFYYRVSPPMAEFITEHPSLKPIVRVGLLPVVAMSTVAVNTTPAEKMAIVGLLVLASVALAAWVTRRRGRGPEYT